MNIKDFLTIRKAAKILGISPSTLRLWSNQGKISTYRNPMNKYRLYKLKDIEDLNKQIFLEKK